MPFYDKNKGMITLCGYLGEQVVPFRIRYANLGEKVLKRKRGRHSGGRRWENSVIHCGAGPYLLSATLRRDRISAGAAARFKLQGNKSRELTRSSVPRNMLGQRV